MKEKLKKFFIEKKELLLFVGVLIVVFSTVIFIADYALSQDTPVAGYPSESESSSSSSSTDVADKPSIDNTDYKIMLPIEGEYVIVRTFFNSELPLEELTKAVINTGTYMIESQGISYAKEDNSVFDVYNVYPGTVKEVVSDALEGTVVTIEHDHNITSKYYSLSEVSVKVGDKLEGNVVIGKAGTSILDNEAGVHVHLEIVFKNECVNPKDVIGKNTSEVSSIK